MTGLLCFVLAVLALPFKSKLQLEAENAVLRHQLNVLRRSRHGRVRLTTYERLFFTQLYRWFPAILKVLAIIRPETLMRWHRAGFRRYWRGKSRRRGGRPPVETELRALIRRISIENPLWGAPRIHGELLKLGFEVAQSSVAKYRVKRRGPPSQGWRAFLRNHAPDIAAMDLFVVPTIGFDPLHAFVIVRLDRRELVWISVTTHPTAEWVARQITEAFPWDEAPHYLIRDRDRIYGSVVTRRLRAMSSLAVDTSLEAIGGLQPQVPFGPDLCYPRSPPSTVAAAPPFVPCRWRGPRLLGGHHPSVGKQADPRRDQPPRLPRAHSAAAPSPS